jgi:single-strand DNA-binding protein
VAKLGLAVNRKYRGSDNEMKEEVTFVNVASFGRDAETLNRYLKKGSPLLVDGRLRLHQWETEKGEKQSKIEVIAERFQFLPRAAGDGAPATVRPAVTDDDPIGPSDAEPPQERFGACDSDDGEIVSVPF